MTQYDVAVIGSSPLLLIAATLAAAEGRRVVMLEAQSDVGGAWACDDWKDLAGVELGAHYLYCSPAAYRFLRQSGVALEQMRPAPFAIRSGRRLPLWTQHKVGRLAEAFADRDSSEVRRQVGRLLTYGRYLYPVGGARALIRPLVARALSAGVELRTASPVHAIRIQAEAGRAAACELSAGTLLVDRIVTGESLRIDRFCVAGRVHHPERVDTGKTHVLMRFNAEDCTQLTYAEFTDHSLLRRVSLAHRPAGEPIVWAVEVSRGERDHATLIADVGHALQQVGLLRRSDAASDARVVTYTGSFWQPADRVRLLASAAGALSVLSSWTCFGDSLVQFLRERAR